MITPLELFKNRLSRAGFALIVNWAMDDKQFKIEHCLIRNEQRTVNVMFCVSKENHGFTMFLESQQITMNDMLKEIEQELC